MIVAEGLKRNSSREAYAVWLVNSASDARLLGFVNPGVKRDGRLHTAGVLPREAGCFTQLLFSLEITAHPARPHGIVLACTLALD